MHTVVGVFRSRTAAERAIEELRESGVAISRITFLAPGASESEMASVPVTETEQPGMGKAVGGVVGGALGAAGGIPLGMAAASAFLPGVGPVLILGTAAAALLAIGGLIGGVAAGEALENLTMEGLPKDELFIYADALEQGRSIVMTFLDEDQGAAQKIRGVLARTGAESLDAARENWWVGIRDAEEERYMAAGDDFKASEPAFRLGFEAALHHRTCGKTYEGVQDDLRQRYPTIYADEAFRKGFERGRVYYWVFKNRQPR